LAKALDANGNDVDDEEARAAAAVTEVAWRVRPNAEASRARLPSGDALAMNVSNAILSMRTMMMIVVVVVVVVRMDGYELQNE